MSLDAKQQGVMNSLLIEAVSAGDLPRMKSYVSKGADINARLEITETIRMNGTYTSQGGAPLYHYMLETSFAPPISDFFFSQGVSVDVKNHNGNTPLMLAVKNGDLGRVKYFLSKGADPMAVNARGDIVLEAARLLQAYYCNDRQRIIDALVEAVASPIDVKPAPVPETRNEVETTRDIKTLRPIEFAPRKKGSGFNL